MVRKPTQAAFELVLTGLYKYGLLKGRHLGIDSSVIEVNASLPRPAVTKQGACDMIDKPEHITDRESGAIVMATVRQGDEGDTVAPAFPTILTMGP